MRALELSKIGVLAILSTASSFGASITVNGLCQANCAAPGSIGPGENSSLPFNFVYTFANTDRYSATGLLTASNTSNTNSTIQITAADILLTYLGNSTATSSSSDILIVDFAQTFTTPFSNGTNNSGFEFIRGNFSGSFAGASSVTAQGFSNGTSMQLMGPFMPPNSFELSLTGQPFSFGPTTTLIARDTVTFGAGSLPGAAISISNVPTTPSAVPEPATWLVTGAGLVLTFIKRKSTGANF